MVQSPEPVEDAQTNAICVRMHIDEHDPARNDPRKVRRIQVRHLNLPVGSEADVVFLRASHGESRSPLAFLVDSHFVPCPGSIQPKRRSWSRRPRRCWQTEGLPTRRRQRPAGRAGGWRRAFSISETSRKGFEEGEGRGEERNRNRLFEVFCQRKRITHR